jgi:hypothetical protein
MCKSTGALDSNQQRTAAPPVSGVYAFEARLVAGRAIDHTRRRSRCMLVKQRP